jgi:hypothetical protein
MTGVVELVGKLVDIAAVLPELAFDPAGLKTVAQEKK